MVRNACYLAESKIRGAGVGVFTDLYINKGSIIYKPNPILDTNLTQEEYNSLDLLEQDEVSYFGYFHKKTMRWHVAHGVIGMINHSDYGNVTQDENMVMIAKLDIPRGAELTQNYDEIYTDLDKTQFNKIYKYKLWIQYIITLFFKER